LGKKNGCWGRDTGRLEDVSQEDVCGPKGQGRGVFKSLGEGIRADWKMLARKTCAVPRGEEEVCSSLLTGRANLVFSHTPSSENLGDRKRQEKNLFLRVQGSIFNKHI
jgi:hypothetical protein